MRTIFILLLCFSAQLHPYTDADVEKLKQEIIAARSTIYGWCSQEKLLNFVDLVLEVKPEVCVEIGAYGGASVLPIAYTLKFLKDGVIFAIDPWDFIECIRRLDSTKYANAWKTWLSIDMDVVHADFLKLLNRYHLEDVCMPLRMTSEKAIAEIDSPIDILHIDGDHSEYGSMLDVTLYVPKVRSGGYIWLTDAIWQERGEAVDYILETCDFVKSIDDYACFLFRKR